MKMIRLEGAQEVVCRTQLYSLIKVFFARNRSTRSVQEFRADEKVRHCAIFMPHAIKALFVFHMIIMILRMTKPIVRVQLKVNVPNCN